MPEVTLEQILNANVPGAEPTPRNAVRTADGRVSVPPSVMFAGLGPDVSPEEDPSLVGGALKRGALTVKSDFSAVGGLVADVFGYDDAAQGFYNRAKEIAEERDQISRRVGSVEEIKGALDVGIFALESILENAALLASIAIPGIGGAKIASFAGRAAAGRAVAAGTKTVAQAAQGLNKSSKTAGTLAAFMSDVGLQTGESTQIALEAGQDPADIRVVGSGLGKGALDFVPVLALAKKLGLGKNLPFSETLQKFMGKELVDRGFIRRAIGNASTLVAFEVPTEVAQEIINISLDRSFRAFEGQLTPEEKSQLLNAAAGAATFGLLGIPAAVFKPAGEARPATEAELNAADDAPGPGGGRPALPPPNIAGLLTAPAIRVTPEGVAILPGTERVDYDPAIDTPKTGTSVAEGVARALGREQAPDRQTVFSVTSDGVVIPSPIDTHEESANVLRAIPQNLRTPLEQGVIDVEDARQETLQTDTFLIPLSTEQQQEYPATIQTLLQARDDTYLAPGFRRSTDGQLTRAGQARVTSIDKRITKIVERLGIANPLDAFSLKEIKDSNELSAFNATEETRRATRPDGLLTSTESALLDTLEERDVERGLSGREEEIREKLIAKREGEEEAGREKLTPQQVKELRELGNEIGDEESVQLRLREDEDLNQRNIQKINAEILEIINDEPERVNASSQLSALEQRYVEQGVDINSDAELQQALSADVFSGALRNMEIAVQPIDTQKGPAHFPLQRATSITTPKVLLKQFRDLQKQVATTPGINTQQNTRYQKLIRRQAVLMGMKARFRKAAVNSQGRLTVEFVTKETQKFSAKLARSPEFIVAVSRDKTLFADNVSRRELARNARGMFLTTEPNRVYIFADNLTSKQDLKETLLHETLAHFGLRAYFTEEQLIEVLDQVYTSRGGEIQDRFGVPKNRTEALKFAEEFIAEKAESGTDLSFMQKVIALIRRMFRKLFPRTTFTDNDINFMLRDVGLFLSGRIPGRNPAGITGPLSNEAFLREVGQENAESILPSVSSWRDVWGAKFQALFLTPLQIAERSDLAGVKEYIELTQLWAARKNTLIKEPDDIAKRWLNLPRKEGQILSQVLLEAMEASELAGRALTQDEEFSIMRRNGASVNVFNMYKEVRASFDGTLNMLQDRLELAAIRDAAKNAVNPEQEAQQLHTLWRKDRSKAGTKAFIETVSRQDKLAYFNLTAKLINIEKEMSVLKNGNYFPRMRFGQYAIIVRAQKDIEFGGRKFKGPTDGKLGEVVNYETFEDPGSRKARRPSVETQFKDQTQFQINEGFVSDEEFSFLGMPPALFEALKSNLDLSPSQRASLQELYFRYSPGKAFLRHLTQRKGVDGYNTDAVRVYANYMMNAASHIARVEYAESMQVQQKIMQDAARDTRQGTRSGILADYFAKHFKYIMNPENDLATLRAAGFLFYLGFNVKSAAVNLTQVPMVAYPFLASIYGDGAATGALMRSYAAVTKRLTGKGIYDQLTDEALTRGIEEGFLDESMVTELASIGEGEVLQRIMPENANVRLMNKVSYYGSFLFRHAEKINREIVFIAARELALKKNPGDQENAFRAGRRAVQATMFEYKKWNRPTFMRGKKSVFFLFWQYMQHLSFIAYGGEGKGAAMRTWAMLLLAAGVQGLPFMENILDLLDFGGTQAKEALKLKDPRVDLRSDLRELVSNITDKPDLIMHGMSRYYGLGPMHLLSALGVPVPTTDISGSLSSGRVIPGIDDATSPSNNPSAKFGRTIIDVMGPVAGMGYNFWKALESEDPDQWKVWERAMPTAMAGASKAIRRLNRGEETFTGGGAVVKFDPQDTEQFLESTAQFFGFATTRVNQRFELRASQEGLKQYWVIRRSKVLENFTWAVMTEDQEAIDVATKRLTIFNKSAPAPGLMIDAKALRASIKERFRRAYLREVGLPNEKAFRGLYQELGEASPEGLPVAR